MQSSSDSFRPASSRHLYLAEPGHRPSRSRGARPRQVGGAAGSLGSCSIGFSLSFEPGAPLFVQLRVLSACFRVAFPGATARVVHGSSLMLGDSILRRQRDERCVPGSSRSAKPPMGFGGAAHGVGEPPMGSAEARAGVVEAAQALVRPIPSPVRPQLPPLLCCGHSTAAPKRRPSRGAGTCERARARARSGGVERTSAPCRHGPRRCPC